jgi:hypothetical protein
MNPISIPAHFDGKHIQLDEPVSLPMNAKLIVTVLPMQDAERADWTELSQEGLAAAYGDDEPEYTLDCIKEANPDYEGR